MGSQVAAFDASQFFYSVFDQKTGPFPSLRVILVFTMLGTETGFLWQGKQIQFRLTSTEKNTLRHRKHVFSPDTTETLSSDGTNLEFFLSSFFVINISP